MLMLPTPHKITLENSLSGIMRFGTHRDANGAPTPYILCTVRDGVAIDWWLSIGHTIVSPRTSDSFSTSHW